MQNYPRNSHLNLDILISYTTLEPMYEWLKSWYTNTLATYILVRKGTSISDLEKKFPEFIESHRPEDERNSMDLYLQSLKDIHLHSNHILYQTFNHNQGNINTVYTFSIIAVFILLIAAINYMNLSTARSLKRAREVGMRKVFGSSRRSLILQFLSESLLISFLALIFVRLLLEFAFPSVAPLLPDRLIDTYYDTGFFILEMIGITTFIGIIAGSYPAFFLSAFRPATTLKGNFSIGQRGAFLRKVLVVSQFSIAIALIASTGVVKDQLYYIQNKELGYSIDQVVYVPLKNKTTRSKLTLLKNEYLKNSNILSVAGTSGLRGASGSQGTMKVADQDESRMMMRYSFVDFDYIKTMGMTIIRGRDFSKSISSDTLTSVIINQTAIKELGWEDPLGKQFMAGDGEENYTVIGVVNDFHFYTLRQKIEPLIMWLDPDRFRYLIAKIRPENVDRTLEYMQQTWKILQPAFPFEISFLDQHFYEIYLRDRNTGKLFGLFSAVAIFIACLGLLGLAASTVEQKTKEIGIRKVLGASVFGIVSLLAKDFIKWVAFASLIGFPLAYFTIKYWRDNFVYKTGISTFTFLIAALIVLFISLLTVSYQAIKASVTNPVQSLRYE
jgi:putative ABC transport system permease protein